MNDFVVLKGLKVALQRLGLTKTYLCLQNVSDIFHLEFIPVSISTVSWEFYFHCYITVQVHLHPLFVSVQKIIPIIFSVKVCAVRGFASLCNKE